MERSDGGMEGSEDGVGVGSEDGVGVGSGIAGDGLVGFIRSEVGIG